MTIVTSHLENDPWPLHGGPEEDTLAVWKRALVLDVSLAPFGYARVPKNDEARYDSITQNVVFRRDTELVTSYPVRRREIPSCHGWAVLEAVEAQNGPIEEHRKTYRFDSNKRIFDE